MRPMPSRASITRPNIHSQATARAQPLAPPGCSSSNMKRSVFGLALLLAVAGIAQAAEEMQITVMVSVRTIRAGNRGLRVLEHAH